MQVINFPTRLSQFEARDCLLLDTYLRTVSRTGIASAETATLVLQNSDLSGFNSAINKIKEPLVSLVTADPIFWADLREAQLPAILNETFQKRYRGEISHALLEKNPRNPHLKGLIVAIERSIIAPSEVMDFIDQLSTRKGNLDSFKKLAQDKNEPIPSSLIAIEQTWERDLEFAMDYFTIAEGRLEPKVQAKFDILLTDPNSYSGNYFGSAKLPKRD